MVNGISVRLLLAIASKHELTSISIVFVLAVTISDLDMDVFRELPLVIGVDGNGG